MVYNFNNERKFIINRRLDFSYFQREISQRVNSTKGTNRLYVSYFKIKFRPEGMSRLVMGILISRRVRMMLVKVFSAVPSSVSGPSSASTTRLYASFISCTYQRGLWK